MKAITIQQPHAFAAAAALKPCENRGQRITYRGALALHAGLRLSRHPLPDPGAAALFTRLGGPSGLWRLAVAAVSLAGPPLLAVGGGHRGGRAGRLPTPPRSTAARFCCAPWGQLRHGDGARPAQHLIITAVRALPQPVPCPGQQITPWTLPPPVAAAVRSQLDSR